MPTVGERDEMKIAQAARKANGVRARVLNFGVGYDVNSRLLDRLGNENHGASEYVRPNEDIEAHVSKVYSRISAPVLDGMLTSPSRWRARRQRWQAGESRLPTGEVRPVRRRADGARRSISSGGKMTVKVSGEVRDEIHAFGL
ncbi:MAG: hypothetical protein R3B90_17430 [Planctomycetaceae bacterium]